MKKLEEKLADVVFHRISPLVMLVLAFLLTFGDALWEILGIRDTLRISIFILLMAFWLYAATERAEQEEIIRQLKAPRALYLKDTRAVHQAAADLLEIARTSPAPARVVITDLRVSAWARGEETAPERARYQEAKQALLREGRIGVRQVFNLPGEASLDNLLNSELQPLAQNSLGRSFQVKAFARGEDLPHVDVLAVEGVGAVFAFPDPLQAAWNAAGIRLDDPEITKMALRYFEALWGADGFLIFDRGELKADKVDELRRVLRGEERLRVLETPEDLYQATGDLVEQSTRIRVQALGRSSPYSPAFESYWKRVLRRLENVEVDYRRMAGASLSPGDRELLNSMARYSNVALKGYPGEINVPAVVIGDQEVVIAIRDRSPYELRRGILIRDQRIADMLREWFDSVLWEEPAAVLLKKMGMTDLHPGALERLEQAARGGMEIVLDRERNGEAYRRAREVIEKLVEQGNEILILIHYEGVWKDPGEWAARERQWGEDYQRAREAYYRVLLEKVRQGAAYRRIIAFHQEGGHVAPGYVPPGLLAHMRDVIKLKQGEAPLRDRVSLQQGTWRLDLHSFAAIPGKAAIISLDRPEGALEPMEGILIFYHPSLNELINYLAEIWRSIAMEARPIAEIPES